MIIGIAAAIAALALNLLAGGFYYVSRKRTQPSPIEPGAGSKTQGLTADLMTLAAIQQGMVSARGESASTITSQEQCPRSIIVNFPGNPSLATGSITMR